MIYAENMLKNYMVLLLALACMFLPTLSKAQSQVNNGGRFEQSEGNRLFWRAYDGMPDSSLRKAILQRIGLAYNSLGENTLVSFKPIDIYETEKFVTFDIPASFSPAEKERWIGYVKKFDGLKFSYNSDDLLTFSAFLLGMANVKDASGILKWGLRKDVDHSVVNKLMYDMVLAKMGEASEAAIERHMTTLRNGVTKGRNEDETLPVPVEGLEYLPIDPYVSAAISLGFYRSSDSEKNKQVNALLLNQLESILSYKLDSSLVTNLIGEEITVLQPSLDILKVFATRGRIDGRVEALIVALGERKVKAAFELLKSYFLSAGHEIAYTQGADYYPTDIQLIGQALYKINSKKALEVFDILDREMISILNEDQYKDIRTDSRIRYVPGQLATLIRDLSTGAKSFGSCGEAVSRKR